MKVLVVGGGGREHALAWKLRQSESVAGVYVAPGNAGTKEIATSVAIPADDIAQLKQFALDKAIDLIVVGSHGYRPLKRFLMGSVSQAVALHAQCSVEIVRCHENK